eukprot:scaffold129201_cov63-Phaeocystis_antarctica.AAC.1
MDCTNQPCGQLIWQRPGLLPSQAEFGDVNHAPTPRPVLVGVRVARPPPRCDFPALVKEDALHRPTVVRHKQRQEPHVLGNMPVEGHEDGGRGVVCPRERP